MLYPNPNNGHFWLSMPGEQVVDRVLVFDQLGQLVYLREQPAFPQRIMLELKPGLYYVHIQAPSDTWRLPIIINPVNSR